MTAGGIKAEPRPAEFLTTNEIFAELAVRYPDYVFIGQSRESVFDIRHTAGIPIIVGLLHWANGRMAMKLNEFSHRDT